MSEAAAATETHGDAYEGENYDDGSSEESGQSDKLRAGNYRARARLGAGDPSEGWGGTPEAPQVAVDIELLDLGGQLVTSYLSFHPNAAEYSVARLKACGWDGSDALPFVGIDRNEIVVEIKYETYKGKTSMKAEIKTIGRFKHALAPAVAKSFMSDLVRNAAILDKAAGAPTAGARPVTKPAAQAYPADWDKAGPAKAADPARAGKVDL